MLKSLMNYTKAYHIIMLQKTNNKLSQAITDAAATRALSNKAVQDTDK